MALHFKSVIRKLRILPVLIVVASFGFVVRLGDSYIGLKSMSGTAYAEEKTAEKPEEKSEEKKPEDKPEEENKTSLPDSPVAEPPADELTSKDKKEEGSDSIDLPSTDATVPEESDGKTKWEDASDTELADSDIKKEVSADFAKRRQELEAKEKKMAEREALLEAAQKELDKKFKEMEGLRDELKDLLKQQTTEEATRIQSLVKIYSGMKPKDAARIFNTLDTDILMDLVGSMPEAKSGAIMALMEADRAKALTTLLAEQKKLPEVP